MWVAKLQIDSEDKLLGSRTKKFRVVLAGYPVSSYEKGVNLYLFIAGFLTGKEKNKIEFINDLRKDKRVLNLENKGDFIIGQIKQPPEAKILYRPNIIHLEPVIIDERGYTNWTIGSWDKKALIDLIKVIKKIFKNCKLIHIKERKITSFSIVSIRPELTEKQEKAVELAIKNSYYDYPRKIELKRLAKLMRLSYSTYQAHLRKAEKKLIHFLFNKTK